MTEIDLSLIEDEWQHRVIQAFEDRDVGQILITMSNRDWLAFTYLNIGPLKEIGIYEKMLLEAYTGCALNHGSFPIYVMGRMFAIADKEVLLQTGDPLPDGAPYRLFRGVAGNGRARRKGGISWTADFDRAVWFAKRFSAFLKKPMVYEAIVEREHVIAYDNSRQEQEFLCLIPDDLKLKKVWS